ncbi:MAG: hypothetical protein ACK5LN_08230 [Propioniciclava sp.]
MQQLRSLPTPRPAAVDNTSTRWVDAAPFRAQLLHLTASTGLPWQVIATHADLPPGLASRLLFADREHQLPRIPVDCARRLLAVSAETLATKLRARVAAAPTIRRLRELIRRGWGLGGLSAALDCEPSEVEHLLDARLPSVTLHRAYAVLALLALSDRLLAGRPVYGPQSCAA